MTPDDDPRLDALRARLLDVGDEPDVAPAVMARIADDGRAPIIAARRHRRMIPLVAAAVAGIVIGATVASGGLPWRRPSSVSAGVTQRVLSAQTRVDALSADMSVVERGWQRAVPARSYTGTLRFQAPESCCQLPQGKKPLPPLTSQATRGKDSEGTHAGTVRVSSGQAMVKWPLAPQL